MRCSRPRRARRHRAAAMDSTVRRRGGDAWARRPRPWSRAPRVPTPWPRGACAVMPGMSSRCWRPICVAIAPWRPHRARWADNQDNMEPIGIFGGTFDPIHVGHLRTAFELWQALHLTEVRFLPTGNPPHRSETRANAELRLAMVRAAVEGQAGFVVDDREVRRTGLSYSVDTLTH